MVKIGLWGNKITKENVSSVGHCDGVAVFFSLVRLSATRSLADVSVSLLRGTPFDAGCSAEAARLPPWSGLLECCSIPAFVLPHLS